ncbi:MAG: ECF transporter S component, partial [Anaerotignum sp.]|nr:ECF transporter S component [Anaerotignum sp.]
MSEVETKVEEVKATTAKKKRMNVKDLTTLGLLTGILLVMAFTPLGYFHTFGLDISLMMIPVGIGAMLMGPKAGAWLGFIFGATSFYQAVTGASPFSAMLFNISPVNTFLLCIPTRMLMGFVTGLIFLLVSKLDKKKTVCFFVGGFFAAFLNTVFFMSTLILLFWNTDYIQGFNQAFGGVNPFLFVVMFVGVNGMLEWPASCIAG